MLQNSPCTLIEKKKIIVAAFFARRICSATYDKSYGIYSRLLM